MPFYDLKCGACGIEFEELLPLAEAPIDEAATCPSCGKKRVRVHVKKAPSYHNRYSPLHPRKNRGRGF